MGRHVWSPLPFLKPTIRLLADIGLRVVVEGVEGVQQL